MFLWNVILILFVKCKATARDCFLSINRQNTNNMPINLNIQGNGFYSWKQVLVMRTTYELAFTANLKSANSKINQIKHIKDPIKRLYFLIAFLQCNTDTKLFS